jgi:uncharacterized membrane protein
VLWALVLLLLIIYTFAIVLTQAVTEHTVGQGFSVSADDPILKYWGDLTRSMMSLWMAVTDGVNWSTISEPLANIDGGEVWVTILQVYIAFVFFAVLNVVTGVFCQNAVESAQQDLDTLIHAQLIAKERYVEHLSKLFQELDSRKNQRITPYTLIQGMDRPKVRSWFTALDVDTRNVWKLFKLLDPDGSGGVDIGEFVDGCLRLRGSATRIDLESLKWEIKAIKSSIDQLNGSSCDQLNGSSCSSEASAPKLRMSRA